MAEQKKYLYHCDCCGELFESARLAQADIVCMSCGQHPVRPKFASVAAMPTTYKREANDTHGIPGKDEADIFSMQKSKQRKNWTAVCAVWIAGLAFLTFITYRTHNKAQAAVKEDIELDDQDKAYLARKEKAFSKCRRTFYDFITATSVQSKSNHILNGSDLILDINNHYTNNLINTNLVDSVILNYELTEIDGQSRLSLLLNYTPKQSVNASPYNYEIVFWKDGDEWLIDWPHLVRLAEVNWFRFIEGNQIGTPYRFKLYARELITESLNLSRYHEYSFSEALNNSNNSKQLPKPVFVQNQSKLKTQLTKAFKELEREEQEKNQNQKILRTFEPHKSLRVDVTLEFEEIEGETILVLKEIHNFDWLTPPAITKTKSK